MASSVGTSRSVAAANVAERSSAVTDRELRRLDRRLAAGG
jgi:hypothetical protein